VRDQSRLSELPDGTKLALRDLSLTFPVGLAETCRQAFQVLRDRLLEQTSPPASKRARGAEMTNAAYNRVVSLLVTARDALPLTAFSPHSGQVGFY